MSDTQRLAVVIAACAATLCARAQVPEMINYQGRLVDGGALVNGSVAMELRLYTNALSTPGEDVLYADSNTVQVVDGLYSTFLGDDTQTLVDTINTGAAGSPVDLFFGCIGEDGFNGKDDDLDAQIDEEHTIQRHHTIGQTFVVSESSTVLTSLTFYLTDTDHDNHPRIDPPTRFEAYVMAWDASGDHATGAVLFQSSWQDTIEDGTIHAVDFTGLSVPLPPGTYVAFVHTLNFGTVVNNMGSAVVTRELDPSGTYGDGQLVTKINGTLTFDALSAETWIATSNRDAQVVITLESTVPLAEVLEQSDLFMEVEVDGTVLTPRERLTSVPYAVRAGAVPDAAIETVMLADGSIVSGKVDWASMPTGLQDGDDVGLTAETDPIYSGDPAASITNAGSGSVITAAERTKLLAIEALADVTDAGNVAAAGALMTDGSQAMSADLDMGGKSITNISPTSLLFSDGAHALKSSGDTVDGDLTVTGTVAAAALTGDASGLSNVDDALRGYDENGAFTVQPMATGSNALAIGSGASADGDYAFAVGRRAKATNEGAFVWADSEDADFASTADSQFLVRAAGGVGIGTNVTSEALTVAGNVMADQFIGSGAGLTSLSGGAINAGTISNVHLAVGSVTGDRLGAIHDLSITGEFSARTMLFSSPGTQSVAFARGTSDGRLAHIDSDDQGDAAYGVWGDGNFIYLANQGGGLHTYSVDVSGDLIHIDSDDQGDYANGVWGDGNFIYLANYGGGLHTYTVDISGNLTHIDSDDQGDTARAVWGDGDFIYLANGYVGLHTYSVDASGNLTHIDSDDQGDIASGVWGDGNFIYLANGPGGLHTYSVDVSSNLTHIDSDDQGDYAVGVWGDDNFVYLANGLGGLHTYSVDGSGYLTHIDSDDQGDYAAGVWGDGNFIYLANGNGGLHRYSVDGSGNLTHIDSDDQGDYANGVWGDGNFIYLANVSGGLHTYSLGPVIQLGESGTDVHVADNLLVDGAATATSFSGDGSGLTSVPPAGAAGGDLSGTYPNPEIAGGTIVNADINSSAAIASSKISGALTDVAGHGLGALATKSSVASADISNDTIVNADINSSAAIVDTKLATISSAGKVADSALSANVSLLGSSISSAEIVNGTVVNDDIKSSAAIAPYKISGTAATLTGSQNFDGGTLYINSSANEVGIGDTTPDAKLDVYNAGAGASFRVDDAASDSTPFIIDNSGNVGIGDASPAGKLQVVGDEVRIGDAGTPGTATGDGDLYVEDALEVDGDTTLDGTTLFVDASANKVGIGESAPLAALHVRTQNIGVDAAALENDEIVVEAEDAVLSLYSSDGGSWGSAIALKEITNSVLSDTWGLARLTSDNTQGSDLRLTYGTDENYGNNAVIVEFEDTGQVGIGVTSPQQKLEVNGNARFHSIASGAYAGPVNRTSDGTLTTATSDERMKRNVATIDGALAKVAGLRGVTFEWKDQSEAGPRVGLIAQEVEDVVPEAVFTNPVDGYKGVLYGELISVLVEAIKEQQRQIEQLRQELEGIKAVSH